MISPCWTFASFPFKKPTSGHQKLVANRPRFQCSTAVWGRRTARWPCGSWDPKVTTGGRKHREPSDFPFSSLVYKPHSQWCFMGIEKYLPQPIVHLVICTNREWGPMGFYPSWPSHSQVPASAKARLLCLIHLESDQVLKSGEGPKKQKQNKPWNPSFDVVCSHDTWPILVEWKTSHMECQTLWRVGLIEDFHGLDPQTHYHHLAKKHLPMAESIFVVSAAGDVHRDAGFYKWDPGPKWRERENSVFEKCLDATLW